VLEDRIRVVDRELHRQKKLAERRKRPVLLDLHSKPELGERVIRRFALVEQAEEMDCGAACLAMICRHYGIPMTLGKAARTGQRDHRGRHAGQPGARANRLASPRAACNARAMR
jgi:hypothetical protein